MPTVQTLNKVVQNLRNFATAHKQINHFDFCEEWDFATSGTVNLPAMLTVLQPSTIQNNTLTYTFKVYFGDLVHKDLSNKAEVLSDMEQLALDFIYQMQHPDYDWVFDTSNLVLNDFEDSFDCELYGYWMIAKIKIPSPFDRCAIPQTTVNTGSTGCPVVTIRNSDGTINTTVASGGTYTLAAGGACADATVSNSDDSYSVSVASGGALELADNSYIIQVDGVTQETVTGASIKTQLITIN